MRSSSDWGPDLSALQSPPTPHALLSLLQYCVEYDIPTCTKAVILTDIFPIFSKSTRKLPYSWLLDRVWELNLSEEEHEVTLYLSCTTRISSVSLLNTTPEWWKSFIRMLVHLAGKRVRVRESEGEEGRGEGRVRKSEREWGRRRESEGEGEGEWDEGRGNLPQTPTVWLA